MNEELIEFYGKYNEEKRLLTPYGHVEFYVTMHYLEEAIGDRQGLKILEIGAATGRYALELARRGHDVTAVDLVPYNIGILKQKAEREGIAVRAYVGNALSLKKEASDEYDLVLLFGPLYHLFDREEKVRCLTEAKRVLKPGGLLFASYILNDFAVLQFGFLEGHAAESLESGKLDPGFTVRNGKEDLFSYDRLEEIDRFEAAAGLTRLKRIGQDGPTNLFRKEITALSQENYELYLKYVLSIAERTDLTGASCHVMDELTK